MGNPHRGEFEVRINERDYRIRYTLGAVAAIQAETQVQTIIELVSVSLLDFRVLQAALFQGMKAAGEDVTRDDIASMTFPITPIAETVRDAICASFDIDLKGKRKKGKAQAAEPPSGTGEKPAS